MADRPTTQPVPLAQPVQLQQATMKSETFGKINNITLQKSKSLQALETINNLIPEASNMIASELNAKAEEDETRQTARALNNLEPTEDATKAGKTAHRLVDVRNTTNEMMTQINEDAINFIGSAEEWEEHVVDRQKELFDTVGQDEDTLNVTGAIFREQLPKAQLVKFRADQERDQQAKYLTAKTSFRGAVGSEFKPEEVMANFGQVMSESVALGMTQSAVQKSLIDAAVEQAALDDLSLIDLTKAIGLYEEVPALQSAHKAAATRMEKEDQSLIAVQKRNLEVELSNSPLMSFESFVTKAHRQRDRVDETIWTEKELRSMYDKQSRGHDKRFNISSLFERSLKTEPIGDGSVVDIDALSGEEKEQMAGMYNSLYEQQLAEVDKNYTDPAKKDEAVRQLLVEKGTWLQGMGIQDKSWTKDFKHLEDLPTSAIREMPEELFQSILATIGRGDNLESVPDVLSSHASPDQQALMLNFKENNLLGMNERQSLILAKEQMAATPIPLRGEEYTKFNKKIGNQVSSTFSSWFDGKESIPDAEIAKAASTIERRAKVWYNVLKDQDKAISRATAEYQATHHQLSDGTMINGNMNLIANKMNIPNNHEFVDEILTSLPSRMDSLADTEGFEDFTLNSVSTDPSLWTKQINADGLLVIKDELGAEVTKPLTLHEAAGFSLEYMKKKREEDKATLNKKRKAAEKAAAKPSNSLLGSWLTKHATQQLNKE